MSLSTEQAKAIKEIMAKVERRSISRMFANPVDPINDNCPNYNEIITRPMDLGTVDKKIEDGSYHNVQEWRSDMELIWSNSLKYANNQKNIIMKDITEDICEYFREESKFISDNPMADWAKKLLYLNEKLQQTAAVSKSKQSIKSPKANKTKKKQPVKIKKSNKKQIDKLMRDIKMLNQDQKIDILEIIEEEEPSAVPAAGGSFDLNLMSLKQTTLNALRIKLDSLAPAAKE